MKYSVLQDDHQRQAIVNRIGQLEGEHFSNVVYIEECVVLGDDASRQELEATNAGIEKRLEHLRQKLEHYESIDPEEDKG